MISIRKLLFPHYVCQPIHYSRRRSCVWRNELRPAFKRGQKRDWGNDKNKGKPIPEIVHKQKHENTRLNKLNSYLNKKGNYIVTTGSLFHLIALTMSDILHLRLFSIFGTMCSITFNLTRSPPYVLNATWSSLFLSINIFMITKLLLDRQNVHFSSQQLHIYETWFLPHGITPRQFLHLLEMAEFREYNIGDVITTAGSANNGDNQMLFILSGEIEKLNSTEKILGGHAGGLLGAKSFLNNEHTSPKRGIEETSQSKVSSDIAAQNQTAVDPNVSKKAEESNAREKALGTSLKNNSQDLADKNSSLNLSDQQTAQRTISDSKTKEIPVEPNLKETTFPSTESMSSIGDSSVDVIISSSAEEESSDSEGSSLAIERSYLLDPLLRGIAGAFNRKTGAELFEDEKEQIKANVAETLQYVKDHQRVLSTDIHNNTDGLYRANSVVKVMSLSTSKLRKWMESDILFALPFTRSLVSNLITRVKSQQEDFQNETYFAMMRACMTDGYITQKEKDVLVSYRVASGISDAVHKELLTKLGWTAEEYSHGKKSLLRDLSAPKFLTDLFH